MSIKKSPARLILIWLAFLGCGVFIYFMAPSILSLLSNKIEYNINEDKEEGEVGLLKDIIKKGGAEKLLEEENEVSLIPVTHIKTPENVRAIYMSGWVSGSEDFRNSLVKMVDETELNAIVIDIKDSTGRISFHTDDPLIKKVGSSENRIKDIRALTSLLHKKNIYIIGQIKKVCPS